MLVLVAYPLHAMVGVRVVWGQVEGRWGLSAGQGQVVLAGQVHLPHHLSLQTPVQLVAVL